MPISKKLKEFLDQNNIKYATMSHSRAYTAQEIAASTHVPGQELAKTVIIKADGEFKMAVLPASYKINFSQLKKGIGAKKVTLATELEFKDLFPECEIGAMPPFGNLYNIPVYVEEALSQSEEIVFNAGSHTEVVRISYEDYKNLVKPEVFEFSEKAS